ncbi:MAG: S4 domain-containing protein [Actinomycetota bacterium]
MPRRRLDTELVRRGLATSRAEAQEAVAAGLVTVSGTPATKAASLVTPDAPLAVSSSVRRFVSRGG